MEGSVVKVDAAGGFAHPAIALGFSQLVPLARTLGAAVLAVRNSYNCGVLGYHTERLAQDGLVGFGFTNSPASIAPVGGRRPIVGTNPWSVAAPDGRNGVAFVIDQSASVIARSEVMKRARLGESIPAGWALDSMGKPTTDAQAAFEGTMVPAGGYKGFGSGLLVELFAACLTGATLGIHASPFSGPIGGPPRTGQFFIAINPAATDAGGFGNNIDTLLSALKTEPGAHVPGDHRKASARKTATGGIRVSAALYDTITELART
jgi:(2R)-3-sulfolactate dehydrogenase (NADP+)